MPRPMRPLDPDAGLVQRFAHELRELRESAGEPTYRELARRTQFSMSPLADAARGDRVPSLAVTLAFVEACAGDTAGWAQRWHKVTATLAEETTEAEASRPPYLGLATYQTTDAELFFGREALLDELLEQLAERGFLAVLGPSGSANRRCCGSGCYPPSGTGGCPRPTPRRCSPLDHTPNNTRCPRMACW